jgi:hypothetical protein
MVVKTAKKAAAAGAAKAKKVAEPVKAPPPAEVRDGGTSAAKK